MLMIWAREFKGPTGKEIRRYKQRTAEVFMPLSMKKECTICPRFIVFMASPPG